MYRIRIIYNTGDSYHHEDGIMQLIEEVGWENPEYAEQAIKDIQIHYSFYKINKDWLKSKKEKDEAIKFAKDQKWYIGDKYPFYQVLIANDEGERIPVHCFWVGYFEFLVAVELIKEYDGMNKRIDGRITIYD